MDYEFRIKILEKELAHIREMQLLNAGRLDVTDTRLERLQEIVLQSAENIDLLARKTAENINALSSKIDTLLDAMIRPRSN